LPAAVRRKPKKLANGEEAKLNFYNWDTYIGETTLEDFKGASGVDVNMTLFASNDELFAKLKAGNQGYDVIVPSNDFVERMAAADMLMPLDHAQIPNFEKNIAPEFKDVPYDPKRKHSMPYTWLTLGIGYRKSKVKGTAR
jgi:spermidine/putrescine transport system substrate-binding protein